MSFQLAIDGTTSSGKSSVAKEVAKKFGFMYIDTGAMYRTFALNCIKKGIDITEENEDKIVEITKSANLEIIFDVYPQKMILDGEDVTDLIRSIEAGENASKIAVLNKVREVLVAMQQDFAKTNDVVMDGRDIGSVVLKDATLKLYIDATVEARATRRMKEVVEKGEDVTLEETIKALETRDYRDKNREVSPLVLVEDAIYIDTSDLTYEEVLTKVFNIINEKRKSV